MQCPACGHDNPAGAKFCSECGAAMLAQRVCERCGTSNQADAKFCSECGAPAAATVAPPPHLAARILRDRASLEGERRTVTVLFIDAVSSVSTGERLAHEELHRIVRGCAERMADAVHRH